MTPSSPAIESILDRAAAMPVEVYDPSLIVAAVNVLQPVGKVTALRAIEDIIVRLGSVASVQGLLWVMRALFDMPAGTAFPEVRIGQPEVPPPRDPAILPRFPLVLIQEVPLLVTVGFVLGGKAEPIAAHVSHYRAHGLVRSRPLDPPAALDGIEAALRGLWTSAYGNAEVGTALETLRAQLARLRNGRASAGF